MQAIVFHAVLYNETDAAVCHQANFKQTLSNITDAIVKSVYV